MPIAWIMVSPDAMAVAVTGRRRGFKHNGNLESRLCRSRSNTAACEAMNRAPVRRQI